MKAAASNIPTKKQSLDMELNFFEFDDEATKTEEIDRFQWRSDDDEDEEGPDETRAFWDSQRQLLQDALLRLSSTELRIQKDTEDVTRKMQSSAGAICTCLKECRRNCLLKFIVDGLRDLGHNSALCKSKWRRSPDIPSGEHSYIDVLVESKNGKRGPIRVVVEPNFRAEFEMARANSGYNGLVGSLPEIFVGKAERLRTVIKIMCGAAKKCVRCNKMHLAPWRKHKYMQSKWLGTCERITPVLLFPAAVAVGSDRPLRPRASMLTFDLHCPAVQVL